MNLMSTLIVIFLSLILIFLVVNFVSYICLMGKMDGYASACNGSNMKCYLLVSF